MQNSYTEDNLNFSEFFNILNSVFLDNPKALFEAIDDALRYLAIYTNDSPENEHADIAVNLYALRDAISGLINFNNAK